MLCLMFYSFNSSSDFMKKLYEIGQQKPADDVEPTVSEEQSAKRQKVTDELRYFKIYSVTQQQWYGTETKWCSYSGNKTVEENSSIFSLIQMC